MTSTRWEEEEVVRRIPVQTYKVEYEERVEQIPVQVSRVVPEQRMVQYEQKVSRYVPYQTERVVARRVMIREPLVADGYTVMSDDFPVTSNYPAPTSSAWTPVGEFCGVQGEQIAYEYQAARSV